MEIEMETKSLDPKDIADALMLVMLEKLSALETSCTNVIDSNLERTRMNELVDDLIRFNGMVDLIKKSRYYKTNIPVEEFESIQKRIDTLAISVNDFQTAYNLEHEIVLRMGDVKRVIKFKVKEDVTAAIEALLTTSVAGTVITWRAARHAFPKPDYIVYNDFLVSDNKK